MLDARNPRSEIPATERSQGNYAVLIGDCVASMRGLRAASVHTCVTSPPYFGLRDYKVEGQIGLEETPEAFVARLVDVFREVRRVLRDDGTLWLNLGDSYAQQGGRGEQGSTSARKGRANVSVQKKRASTRAPDGLKPKDLIGIPWRVAFALQADGWYLRQDIIAGISVRTSSGQSRTRCPRASPTAALRRTNTSSCSRSRRDIILTTRR